VESNRLSDHLNCIVLLTEIDRRQMVDSGMLSNQVVEDLDLFGDFSLGLFSSYKKTVIQQFYLQATPAAFRRRVVSEVTLAGSSKTAFRLAVAVFGRLENNIASCDRGLTGFLCQIH